MTDHTDADPHWQRALDWIQREHEATLDDGAHAELAEWLKADPAHLTAYQEACRIWLIAGLVPPQVTASGCADDPAGAPAGG